MRVPLYLFILLFSYTFLHGQSNEGTNFWFGFMEHRDAGQDHMVVMITSKQNTVGTVRMPLLGWTQNFSVKANEVQIIPLPQSAETLGSETVGNNGIEITSLQPISAYIHQYFNFRSEASVILPINSIGKEYFAMTYNGIVNQGKRYPSEFLIVATEDETSVVITLADESMNGRRKAASFSILLNKGETYQVQAGKPNADLTGSHILADKKVAVFAGNSWTEVPLLCGPRDNLLEQMYPVATWGKRFLTVPSAKVSFDVFRILAAEDDTKVEVQGENNKTYSLDRGEWVEYRMSEPTYIQSNKPVLIAQYLIGSTCGGHTLGDPSMVLLNSVEQTRDTVTLYNSRLEDIQENYINIITRTSDMDLVYFDGQKLVDRGINFLPVGANANFSFARLEVEEGAHTIISEGCGIIATAYGYGFAESYAYSGGASFHEINLNPIPAGGCLNDTVFFDTGLSPDRFSFQWDLGDGRTSKKSKFSHFYPKLGTYKVKLILEDHCLETIDTLKRDLLISLRQAVEAQDDQVLCEGESFALGATDVEDATFLWEGPVGYISEEQFPQVLNSKPNMGGNYKVVGIVSGCATFPSITNINVIPKPKPDLGQDALICTDLASVVLNPGNYSAYLWSDNSTNPTLPIKNEGTFWVEVTDEYGCVGKDEVVLTQQCPTRIFIPNVFSPNGDGNNDELRIFLEDVTTFQFRLFNRWGELVFETQEPTIGWNGTFRGKDAASGVYMYEVHYEGYMKNGDVFSDTDYGTVTLVR